MSQLSKVNNNNLLLLCLSTNSAEQYFEDSLELVQCVSTSTTTRSRVQLKSIVISPKKAIQNTCQLID